MLDQVRIGDKYSLEDFDASVSSRSISLPEKKEIKETVPFSNVTYDFSKINGELYWQERELLYEFEILADSPEELERKKSKFSSWIMNVFNEEIQDPYDPDYHYIGTFSSLSYEDEDCVEKTTATATFMAYPYKIANEETVYSGVIPSQVTTNFHCEVNSAHRITPEITTDTPFKVVKGDVEYTFPGGTVKDDVFKLDVGDNALTITNTGSTMSQFRIAFYEEVF